MVKEQAISLSLNLTFVFIQKHICVFIYICINIHIYTVKDILVYLNLPFSTSPRVLGAKSCGYSNFSGLRVFGKNVPCPRLYFRNDLKLM